MYIGFLDTLCEEFNFFRSDRVVRSVHYALVKDVYVWRKIRKMELPFPNNILYFQQGIF